MTRRTFIGACAQAAIALEPDKPSLAITMDDMNWPVLQDPMGVSEKILRAASKHHTQFALFAVGQYAESETGQTILRQWRAAGHHIGNHTYSHRPYMKMSFDDFSADILRADNVLRPSLSKPLMFRFPLLKEGDTAEKRDRMRAFLAAKGYRNGHVTIDASDWYYDSRLRDRLKQDPQFDVNRYRAPYLDHLWDRATFYDGLSRKVLGRSVPHTILVHYNLINSLFLEAALDMFVSRGWRISGAAQTFQDPVFQSAPKTAPAGESLIWALAKETGKYDDLLRYPGEDDTYEKPKLDRLGL